MATPLRVLFVEDNEDDVALVLRALKAGGYDVVLQRRVQAPDTLADALKESWDVVISDFSMPAFTGPEALTVCQKLVVETPFIIVSGTVSEAEAVTAMRAGAADFIGTAGLGDDPAAGGRDESAPAHSRGARRSRLGRDRRRHPRGGARAGSCARRNRPPALDRCRDAPRERL